MTVKLILVDRDARANGWEFFKAQHLGIGQRKIFQTESGPSRADPRRRGHIGAREEVGDLLRLLRVMKSHGAAVCREDPKLEPSVRVMVLAHVRLYREGLANLVGGPRTPTFSSAPVRSTAA